MCSDGVCSPTSSREGRRLSRGRSPRLVRGGSRGQGAGRPTPADPSGARLGSGFWGTGAGLGSESLDLPPQDDTWLLALGHTVSPAHVLATPGRQPCPRSQHLPCPRGSLLSGPLALTCAFFQPSPAGTKWLSAVTVEGFWSLWSMLGKDLLLFSGPGGCRRGQRGIFPEGFDEQTGNQARLRGGGGGGGHSGAPGSAVERHPHSQALPWVTFSVSLMSEKVPLWEHGFRGSTCWPCCPAPCVPTGAGVSPRGITCRQV